jgi:hypothetical protein
MSGMAASAGSTTATNRACEADDAAGKAATVLPAGREMPRQRRRGELAVLQ